MKLKIHVLVDNCATNNCLAEHGLSYLIEYDTQILFDVGQTDLFLHNARKMQLDISRVAHIALSHGHYDHGNGLKYLDSKNLVAHPNVFLTRYSGKQRKYVGLNQSKEEIYNKFNVIECSTPYWYSEKMVFLGEIPRRHNFEKKASSFYLEDGKEDLLLDDSAIAIKMQRGLFIVTGCSHSGICNIIDYAKEVTGIDQVYGVFGGFHLKQDNRQTKETIKYLKTLQPTVVMPSHCTDLPALSRIYIEFKGEQVKAGNLYTFDDIA